MTPNIFAQYISPQNILNIVAIRELILNRGNNSINNNTNHISVDYNNYLTVNRICGNTLRKHDRQVEPVATS